MVLIALSCVHYFRNFPFFGPCLNIIMWVPKKIKVLRWRGYRCFVFPQASCCRWFGWRLRNMPCGDSLVGRVLLAPKRCDWKPRALWRVLQSILILGVYYHLPVHFLPHNVHHLKTEFEKKINSYTACYGRQKYPRKVLSWYFRRKLSHVRSVWQQKVPSKVWKLLLLQKIARFGEKVW